MRGLPVTLGPSERPHRLSLNPPIPTGIFATAAAHPRVAACAPLLTHLLDALRCGARALPPSAGTPQVARRSANLLRSAGGSSLTPARALRPAQATA